MKSIRIKKMIRIGALFLSLLLLVSSVMPAKATKTVDDLEKETSGLESELSNLGAELKALDKELSQIMKQIKTTSSELKEIRNELAIAKGQEEAQYQSLMARIKYMYENGNTTMLEMLFSSKCVAEFVSKAEYFSAITEYDKNLLAEYAKNSERIASNEAKLVDKQKYLHSLQNELATKEKSLNDKISSTSTELSNYKDQLAKAKEEARKAREAARKAEEEAKKKVKPVIPEKPKQQKPKPQTTVGSAVSYTDEDVELLAALIECEAGYKDYEALLAVGAVVANRMKHPNYPDSVYGVIYHPGQFPPATNGKMDVILERGVKELCVTAAKDALNGKTNVEDCISFRAASSGRPGTVIGTNVFFF